MPAERPPRLPSTDSPPGPWRRLRRLIAGALRPVEIFLRIEAASGVLLLAAAALALGLANSRWLGMYTRFWQMPFGFPAAGLTAALTPQWIVNDGLMVIFFFVVGLEIRLEVAQGQLADWRRAALPTAAALGGMVVPAALYLASVATPPARSGWGVPMATDIAFALGVLAVLGRRVPATLRVLLLALAVIDDLGAILIIAVFYSDDLSLGGLLFAAAGLAFVLGMRRFGVKTPLAYVVPAVATWAGIYLAGIHPAIAGVLIGLVTPVAAIANLMAKLHAWVAFAIMPIFALANAGVTISAGAMEPIASDVATAITMALVVGKPVGVLLAAAVVLRLRLASLPAGVTWRHLVVLGLVAGVGFTMSIFIAQLAFAGGALLAAAKVGVLLASGTAAALALIAGRLLLRAPEPR